MCITSTCPPLVVLLSEAVTPEVHGCCARVMACSEPAFRRAFLRPRSACLKERGRSSAGCRVLRGAGPPRGAFGCRRRGRGLVVVFVAVLGDRWCRTKFPSVAGREGGQAWLPRHVFADVCVHGAVRPRPSGLNHLVDCATGVGVLPFVELALSRAPSITLPAGRVDSGSRRRAARSRRA